MENERFAVNPLLYIQQPTIVTPKAPMQHHYYTPKQTEQKPVKDERKVMIRQTRPLRRTNFFDAEESPESANMLDKSETQQETENLPIPATKEPSSTIKFKEMTLPEKIKYFSVQPDHAPNIRYEVKTADKRIQGVIIGAKEDSILMKVGRRTSNSEIQVSDIVNIRMLGF